jgi:hypothetical protein
MRMKPLSIPRAAAFTLILFAAAGVAGCNSNPVRDVAASVGAGPQMAASPDFVARSRPADLDYMPISATAPERPTPARTAAEIKAAEAEMDALRAQNEAAGAQAAELGKTPPPEPVRLPANTSQQTRQKTNSKRTP